MFAQLAGSTRSVAAGAVNGLAQTQAAAPERCQLATESEIGTFRTGAHFVSAGDESISLTEAAEELGVHYMTVYRHVRTGRLPATRLPGGWSVTRRDLDAYRDQDNVLPVTQRQRHVEERLLDGDDAGVWTLVESALASSMPPRAVIRDLLMPSMHSIGRRWQVGELSILQEHQATSAVTVVLARLGPHVARTEANHGAVVVGTPAGDTHALAASMLADLLRTYGFRVVELGASTPPESFAEQVQSSDPTAVLVSVSQAHEDLADTLTATVNAIRQVNPHTYIAIGGPAVSTLANADLGVDAIHNDVDLLIDELLQLHVVPD